MITRATTKHGGVTAIHLYRVTDPIALLDLDQLLDAFEDGAPYARLLELGQPLLSSFREHNLRRDLGDNGWPIPDGCRPLWGFSDRADGYLSDLTYTRTGQGSKRGLGAAFSVEPVGGAPEELRAKGMHCFIRHHEHGWCLVTPAPAAKQGVTKHERYDGKRETRRQQQRAVEAPKKAEESEPMKAEKIETPQAGCDATSAIRSLERKLDASLSMHAQAVDARGAAALDAIRGRFERLEDAIARIEDALGRLLSGRSDGGNGVSSMLLGAIEAAAHQGHAELVCGLAELLEQRLEAKA